MNDKIREAIRDANYNIDAVQLAVKTMLPVDTGIVLKPTIEMLTLNPDIKKLVLLHTADGLLKLENITDKEDLKIGQHIKHIKIVFGD